MRFLVLLAFLLCTACSSTPWRVDYLQEAKGTADHDAVATRLGAPDKVHKLDRGGDVWTYKYCGSSGAVAGNRGIGGVYGSSRSSCVEYILTFDAQGILKQWERHS